MSDNRPLLPPLQPGTYRAADGSIRRFSNLNSSPNDRPADTTSERLYTVIRQIHEDLDRFSQQLFGTAGSLGTNVPGQARMASGSDRDLRPRFNRDPQEADVSFSATWVPPDPPSLPPLRSLGSRARSPLATFAGSGPRASRYRPVDRYLERYRSSFSTASALDNLDRNIHETDAHLRALLDITGYSSTMPRAPPAMSPHDAAEESRRVKRRKLDSDRVAANYKAIRYGKLGQVEPGPLTMEIVSCDGGLYADEHSYPPENILKNDSSVYCTKSNRCNIVLKHQGGTVFSLKELVIKAPGSRFSCPVREGMVFVSMESDDLLTRTAQYQIQYLPARSHRRGTVIFRHEDDGTGVVRVQSRALRAYSYGADDDDDDDEDDEDDSRTAQIPPEFTTSPAPFNVITECSEDDDESDEDNPAHPRPPRRRTPNRIGALPFESDSEDDSIQIFAAPYRHWPAAADDDIVRDSTGAAVRRRYRLARERLATSNNNNTSTNRGSNTGPAATGGTSGMTLEEAQEASQIATQEAVRAVGGELMAPLAHFFIEKDKNKCTVRFDPPVSGRFILLKMWSPHQDPGKNIDIQGVVVKGFAGPRFVPALDLA